MSSKQSGDSDKIDEVADQLDDIKTTVDELVESDRGGAGGVDQLQKAVERARDAVDDVEDREPEQ